MPPFFTDSCHPAVTRRAASRAVTTSAPRRPGEVGDRPGCLLGARAAEELVGDQPSRSCRRTPRPRAAASARGHPGGAARAWAAPAARGRPTGARGGRTRAAATRRPRGGRWPRRPDWRYVVPVFGSPTWRKTRGPPRRAGSDVPGGTSRAAPPASPRRARPPGSSSSVTTSVSSASRTLRARHSWTSSSSAGPGAQLEVASTSRVERSPSTSPNSLLSHLHAPFDDHAAHLRGCRRCPRRAHASRGARPWHPHASSSATTIARVERA